MSELGWLSFWTYSVPLLRRAKTAVWVGVYLHCLSLSHRFHICTRVSTFRIIGWRYKLMTYRNASFNLVYRICGLHQSSANTSAAEDHDYFVSCKAREALVSRHTVVLPSARRMRRLTSLLNRQIEVEAKLRESRAIAKLHDYDWKSRIRLENAECEAHDLRRKLFRIDPELIKPELRLPTTDPTHP